LAELDFIHFVRLSPEFLQASNELTEGRIRIPVTKEMTINNLNNFWLYKW